MDFLIKNTKGLTLKTKGKYCTEDLVIEIDPSLVEGYMEIDELPEVGLPRVLYKLMLEEPEYYIWENDAWLKLNTKGGGGNATIKRTLSGGTAIPNTGTLREIYFNTDLSVEEVANILSQATYNGEPNYVLMAQDNSNGIAIMQDSGMYIIFNMITQEILFTPIDIGMGFAGWNTNLIVDKKYTFNSELTLLTDDTIGADNELVKSVISSSSDFTPKNETVELSGDYDGSSINILAGEELDIKSLIENEKKIPLKVIDKSKTLPQLFAPTISVTSENRIRITNIHKNGDFNLLRVEYRLCVDGVKTSDGTYYNIDQTPDSTTIMELPLPTEYGSGTHTVSVFAFHEHFIDSELSNEVEITIA